MTKPGPLAGVRVLDLADRTAAFAGKLLAGLGADVLLVEPPDGHPSRSLPPFEADGTRSLFFEWYHAGKRSLALDWRRDPARLGALADEADVVIETEPPGTLAWLSAERPSLIVASATPFGQQGPRRGWKTSDTVAQALGGMLYVNGHPDGPPLRSLGLQAYHQAGVFTAIGVVAALIARDRIGRGQTIDVSIQATVAASLEHVPGFFHQDGRIHRRQGTLHWTRYFRVGRCRDGWVMHCTLGDWTSLVEWVKADGCGAALDDPRYEDVKVRQAEAERIFDALDAWAARYTVAELTEGAQLRRIPYAAVRAPEALLADEHLAARGFFERLDDGVLHVGAPFKMTGSPWRTAPAPRLGDAAGWLGPRAAVAGGGRCERPLDGVRVLDFTWVVAGPVATRILADLGAEVIKIERPGSMDFGDRRGGLTGSLMRGKKSVLLDISEPGALDTTRRLAATADVVIDNFSARVMPNLGLDYADLARVRPDIVCVRMTGFGLDGPKRDHVSYGPTLQAETGYTLLMAEPGGPPAGFGYSYSDLASGNLGALATLAALWHRARTGRGQLVDLAQQEAVASLLGPLLLERAVHGGVSVAAGNASQEGVAVPHGVYRCRGEDRWVAIAVFTDAEWGALAEVIGARDARFATVAGRAAHAADVDALVAEWTRGRDAEEVMRALQAVGVAAGVVADARDLCAGDPQLAARGYFVDVPTPEGSTVRIDGPPYVLSTTPARVSGPGPLLGEDAADVVGALG